MSYLQRLTDDNALEEIFAQGGIVSARKSTMETEIAELRRKLEALERTTQKSPRLAWLEDQRDGTVIKFNKALGSKIYTFVAIKKVNRWYVTNSASFGGRNDAEMEKFLDGADQFARAGFWNGVRI